MDAVGLPDKVGVGCAKGDAGVLSRGVNSQKVSAIEGQQYRNLQIRLPGLVCSQDIVSEVAQLAYDGCREVLVRVECGHFLCFFVCLHLPLDFGVMYSGIGPCIGKVLGVQRWVGIEKLQFTDSEPAKANQQPYRNSGSFDTGVAAAHFRRALDAWKIVAQILRDPLEDLGLLESGEGRQEPLDFLDWFHEFSSLYCFTISDVGDNTNMDLGIAGKSALVLAGSKGLGKVSALALAREGATVTIASRTAVAEDGLDAVRCDVTKPEEIEALFAGRRFDILVNNAGGPPFATFESFTDEQWHAALELNLMSVVRCTRLALPAMKQAGWGRIVNLLSLSVKSVLANSVLSTASRLGVVGMAKLLSDEVAGQGITVNNIASGIILTDRVRQMNLEHMSGSIPARRLGRPEELGDLVAFLASERAAYITGATIPIDGGMARSIL
jgi:3-oxoacyl-[acyl-carrier protein] reductase